MVELTEDFQGLWVEGDSQRERIAVPCISGDKEGQEQDVTLVRQLWNAGWCHLGTSSSEGTRWGGSSWASVFLAQRSMEEHPGAFLQRWLGS